MGVLFPLLPFGLSSPTRKECSPPKMRDILFVLFDKVLVSHRDNRAANRINRTSLAGRGRRLDAHGARVYLIIRLACEVAFRAATCKSGIPSSKKVASRSNTLYQAVRQHALKQERIETNGDGVELLASVNVQTRTIVFESEHFFGVPAESIFGGVKIRPRLFRSYTSPPPKKNRKGGGNALAFSLPQYVRNALRLHYTRTSPSEHRTHNVREWATVVPTGSFRYGIPLRLCPLKRDVFQSAAIREGTKPYACHAVGDGDGGQTAATREGIYPYARHAVGDGDGGQVGAILEGRICNSTRSLSQFNRRYALVKVYHPAVNITYTVFFL